MPPTRKARAQGKGSKTLYTYGLAKMAVVVRIIEAIAAIHMEKRPISIRDPITGKWSFKRENWVRELS